MYTKIVQYGDTVEIYKYDRDLLPRRERHQSQLQKKRAKERRKKALRSKFSHRRGLVNFFRMAHHNVIKAKSVYFFTLTFKEEYAQQTADRHISQFFRRVNELEKAVSGRKVGYISVPERGQKSTKRLHYHILVFNLSTEVVGATVTYRRYNRFKRVFELAYTTTERFTRNLQREFARGYIDVGAFPTITTGIAGYMAKYMGKSYRVGDNANRRYYRCSRNIEKIASAGFNTPPAYLDVIVDLDDPGFLEYTAEYEVAFLGKCVYSKYTVSDNGDA